MKYTRSGGQSGRGPAEFFTGTVYIDGIRNPDERGEVVTWLEPVPDEVYKVSPTE